MTAEPRPDPITPEASVGPLPSDVPVVEPLAPEPAPLLPDVVPVMPVTDVPRVVTPQMSRRKRFVLGFWRVLRPLLSLGLLAIGVALGSTLFTAVQPKDPAVVSGNPTTVPPPAAVQEFIAALSANNSDAVRAAVAPDPYRLLAGELDTRSYQEITSVDTLGTVIDGDRSATEIIIHGSAGTGQNLTINLVVHAMNGVIVDFR